MARPHAVMAGLQRPAAKRKTSEASCGGGCSSKCQPSLPASPLGPKEVSLWGPGRGSLWNPNNQHEMPNCSGWIGKHQGRRASPTLSRAVGARVSVNGAGSYPVTSCLQVCIRITAKLPVCACVFDYGVPLCERDMPCIGKHMSVYACAHVHTPVTVMGKSAGSSNWSCLVASKSLTCTHVCPEA